MQIREITPDERKKAAQILTLAFKDDAIFKYIFGSEEHYYKHAPWIFETWVNWAMLYGHAWINEDNNCVLLMRNMDNPGMSLWSMIKAGMLPTPFVLGWKAFRRFYFEIVAILDKKHAEVTQDTKHWYGWMIGTYPIQQGNARAMLDFVLDKAAESDLPIFLETVKGNLSFYKHLGFEVKDTARVEKGAFDLYFLLRPTERQLYNQRQAFYVQA